MNLKINIITIGNELLEGRTTNTNVKYLCQKLYAAGYLAAEQKSILDQKIVIQNEIEDSLLKFDITICSGGLGPTQDDLTLPVAAKIFNSPFHYDQKVHQRLKKIYKMPHQLAHLKALANIPTKAEVLKKHLGQAPGFIFKKGRKRLILLPGVPYEFEHLVDHEIIPYLKKHFPAKLKEYRRKINLCRVAESHIAPFLDELLKKYPKISLGIYPTLGILSIHLKVKASSQKEANTLLNPYLKEIKKKYPKRFFDGKHETIQQAIHHYFIQNKMTLALAESCTGGYLSSLLTQIPDASKYFLGCLVSYQNEVKNKLLKVKKTTLEKEGAVSAKCVIEMAKGAQKLFNCDVSIAISGIAGPKGGTKAKPVGTVHIALCDRNKKITTFVFQVSGNRKSIIQRSANYALAELWMIRDNI